MTPKNVKENRAPSHGRSLTKAITGESNSILTSGGNFGFITNSNKSKKTKGLVEVRRIALIITEKRLRKAFNAPYTAFQLNSWIRLCANEGYL